MSEETAEYHVSTKDESINDTARNTFAAYGLDILKHAVLLVLYQTNAETLSTKEVREQIGLDDENIGNNFI